MTIYTTKQNKKHPLNLYQLFSYNSENISNRDLFIEREETFIPMN